MRLCHHCAQTSFLALHEVFGLGDASFVKALTPLPGIAERGETCGAVTGCLLALGLVFGRERLDDWAGWRACQEAAPTAKCGGVVRQAVRQAARLILDK